MVFHAFFLPHPNLETKKNSGTAQEADSTTARRTLKWQQKSDAAAEESGATLGVENTAAEEESGSSDSSSLSQLTQKIRSFLFLQTWLERNSSNWRWKSLVAVSLMIQLPSALCDARNLRPWARHSEKRSRHLYGSGR